MIRVRLQIGDGEIEDTFDKWGLIYMDADVRTEAPIKKRKTSSYAEEAGEHTDPRTVQDAFDYTVKFLIEAPNTNLLNANAKIAAFNKALYTQENGSDIRMYKEITFFNDYGRVRIAGIPDPIAQPESLYRRSDGRVMDCAQVELKIRVGDPSKCDFESIRYNMKGEFLADSTADDWYWWPNGVKTPLPVDPVTKRFEFYYPDEITSASYLFSGGAEDSGFECRLKALEEIPAVTDTYFMFRRMPYCGSIPHLDCSRIAERYGHRQVEYVVLEAPLVKKFHLVNAANVTRYSMVVNTKTETCVDGIDFSMAFEIRDLPFGKRAPIISGKHLGARKELATANLYSDNWGNNAMASGARKSVTDTLITYSYDRAAAGWPSVTLMLSEYTHSLLTDAERTAISAKGYTITTFTTPPLN